MHILSNITDLGQASVVLALPDRFVTRGGSYAGTGWGLEFRQLKPAHACSRSHLASPSRPDSKLAIDRYICDRIRGVHSKQGKPAGGGFLLLGARRGQSAGADPRSRDSVLKAEPRHMSWVRTSRRASRWSATDRQRARPGYSLRIADSANHIIGCSYAIFSYFLINCMSTLIFWVAFPNLLVTVQDYFL